MSLEKNEQMMNFDLILVSGERTATPDCSTDTFGFLILDLK